MFTDWKRGSFYFYCLSPLLNGTLNKGSRDSLLRFGNQTQYSSSILYFLSFPSFFSFDQHLITISHTQGKRKIPCKANIAPLGAVQGMNITSYKNQPMNGIAGTRTAHLGARYLSGSTTDSHSWHHRLVYMRLLWIANPSIKMCLIT